jgi:nucleoside-diphosphate-sugar epimerase
MRVFVAGATGAIGAQLVPRHMERDFALTNRLRTEGTVLRYGWFYGPGTSLAAVAEWLPAHPTWRGVLATATT